MTEILIGGAVGSALVATVWWVVYGTPGPSGGIALMLALFAIISVLKEKQK